MKFRFCAVKLSLVIISVFIVQTFWGWFTELFVLNSLSWVQPWRFVTSMFLHGGVGHLVLNLFAFLLFGSILEKFIGWKKFLLVFFVSGIFANLFSVNFYFSSLGASGAIFGVIGALIIIRPGLPIWAFGLPMPIFVAGLLWIGADLIGAFGFFSGNSLSNTGNLAHLSGMLVGFVFGWVYRKLIKKKARKINVSIDENVVRNWEDTYLR